MMKQNKDLQAEESLGLMCFLLTEGPIQPDKRYLQAAERICGEIDSFEDETVVVVLHKAGVAESEDPAPPSQTVMFFSDEPISPQHCEQALKFTFDWPEAPETVAQCSHGVLLSEMMAEGLTPATRLANFGGALQAALETYDVKALHWPTSQRIVEPSHFLEAFTNGAGLVAGPTNTRLFTIEGREPGEKVMDILGMTTFSLPDPQIHFRGLDPFEVAALLFRWADILFKEGDVIEDGQVIGGLKDDDRWSCRREESLLAPDRVVLDINPGPFSPHRDERGGHRLRKPWWKFW